MSRKHGLGGGLDRFSSLLTKEINSTLRRGSLYAILLGCSLGILMILADLNGLIPRFPVRDS